MDNPESAFQMSPDQAQNHKIRPVLGKKKPKQKSISK